MVDKKAPKGGALIDDVGKLVVPFGLLLAEKGLRELTAKSSLKNEDIESSTLSPSKTASKKNVVGGKPKQTQKRGNTLGSRNLAAEFDKLSSDIEHFLQKY